jgi:hypothetical protein
METVEGAASYAPQKAAMQVCESHQFPILHKSLSPGICDPLQFFQRETP